MGTFLVNTQREMTEIKLGSRKSLGCPVDTVVKNLPAVAGDARDASLIPRSGRSPGVGNGTPLQCSCLEDSIDRGAC